MKRYIVNYTTGCGREGVAVIYAANPNQVTSILQNQGRFSSEKYNIICIEEETSVCVPYSITYESATEKRPRPVPHPKPTEPEKPKEFIPYKYRTRVSEFLYKMELINPLDYDYANWYFKTHFAPVPGACSAIYKNGLFARNFDWHYDDTVEFVLNNPSRDNRLASLSVVQLASITRDTLNNYEAYRILPFFTLDGINSKGVCVSINVVPGNEEGWIPTTGTIPFVGVEKEMCMLMIPRYILDNFETAREAVEYIRDFVSVYAPINPALQGYEFHFLVSDSTHSYVLEFYNNTTVIKAAFNYITNFRLHNTTLNEDDTIDYTTVSEFGQGVERYNLIAKNYESLTTKEALLDFMTNNLKFTNAYSKEFNWYTEFTGQYSQERLTVEDAFENPDKYNRVIQIAQDNFKNRVRGDGNTWQTVHTSLYDIENKTLTIISQQDTLHKYEFSL